MHVRPLRLWDGFRNKLGRRWACLSTTRRDALVAAGLLVAFFLLRLPLRSQFLINWDAVNFALGIREFDLLHHQPHPPGYLGYVILGRLFATLAGGANAGLTLLSSLAGAVAPASLYVLGRRFVARRHALAAAVLFGLSPVVIYYSAVALTYMVGAAIVIPLVWTCHRAYTERSARHLYTAAVLLALLGSVRQTDMVFLLPLAAFAAWPHPRRVKVRAAAVLTGLVAAWLLPLVVLSGGLDTYLRVSRELAALAGGPTSVFSGDVLGLLQNLGFVGGGLLIGLNLTLVVVVRAWRAGVSPHRRLAAADRRFFSFWIGPALATYLLLHTGQFGYVLLLLPACYLWLAGALEGLAETSERDLTRPAAVSSGSARPSRSAEAAGRWQGRGKVGWRGLSTATAVALVVANVGAFFAFSRGAYGFMRPLRDDPAPPEPLPTSLVEPSDRLPSSRNALQYALTESDSYWSGTIEVIRRFEPARTAVLTVPVGGGTFRHLAYYLNDYHVYGVGKDRDGRYGHLFSAFGGTIDYQVEGLDRSSKELVLPVEVRRVLIPDPSVAARVSKQIHSWPISVEDGSPVMVAAVPRGATLRFVPAATHPRLSRLAGSIPETLGPATVARNSSMIITVEDTDRERGPHPPP